MGVLSVVGLLYIVPRLNMDGIIVHVGERVVVCGYNCQCFYFHPILEERMAFNSSINFNKSYSNRDRRPLSGNVTAGNENSLDWGNPRRARFFRVEAKLFD